MIYNEKLRFYYKQTTNATPNYIHVYKHNINFLSHIYFRYHVPTTYKRAEVFSHI